MTTRRAARDLIARPRDVQLLGPPARTPVETRSILSARYGSLGNQATAEMDDARCIDINSHLLERSPASLFGAYAGTLGSIGNRVD